MVTHPPRPHMRPFMGAVVATSCLLVSSSTLWAQTWEDDANARIEQNRKGDLQVEVVDGAGHAVQGADVGVAMQRHAYGFGTAVNAQYFTNTSDPFNAQYRQALDIYFNKAVIENGHKWRFWESPGSRFSTVQTTNWLADHDIELRGHTLMWQNDSQYSFLPDDVYNRVFNGTFDAADADYIRDRVSNHFQDITSFYGDQITEWDVANEVYAEHFLTDKLNPGEPFENASELKSWFSQAHDLAPDAKLFINDYGILSGNDFNHRISYYNTVRNLINDGAPIDGIGFQGHFSNGFNRPSGEDIANNLALWSDLGLELQVTEFDMYGPGWGSTDAEIDANQADFLRDFYRATFADPNSTGILMWGFWDGAHWQGNAPLFDENFNLKASGQAYLDLVFNEWWTDEMLVTDEEGLASLRGFLGDYELTVTLQDGTTVQLPFTLSPDGTSLLVTVPEPTIGILAAFTLPLLRRRRTQLA